MDRHVSSLIETAVQAPSSHNTQPWRFRPGNPIEIFADRTRALPVNDPSDRELTISCGAALFNLRVAAAHDRLEPTVETFPESGDPDLLARVFLPAGGVDPALARLYPSVVLRRTTRQAFDDRPVPESLRRALAEAVAAEGATLLPVTEEGRGPVADLVAEGDRRQFSDPNWRRELSSWMHSGRSEDGLTGAGPLAPVTKLVIRHFDLGRSVSAGDATLAREAPFLAVLLTADDAAESWLRAGQALERALLVAAELGATAGFLNQPCQVAELRPRLAEVVGAGDRAPQLLLRFGFLPRTAKPSRRRPVADVLAQ